jgi:hypothetical protein
LVKPLAFILFAISFGVPFSASIEGKKWLDEVREDAIAL